MMISAVNRTGGTALFHMNERVRPRCRDLLLSNDRRIEYQKVAKIRHTAQCQALPRHGETHQDRQTRADLRGPPKYLSQP